MVSPPLPSGMTWLVNLLLELGIRATGHGCAWRQSEQSALQLEPAFLRDKLAWFLPALHTRASFTFPEPIEVFWDHQLAFMQYPSRPTILLTRDPRDAAWSEYRRRVYQSLEAADESGLLEMLARPELWVHTVTLPMLLPAADITAYFYLAWLHQLPPGQLLVIRFEDAKADPAGQIRRLLAFLGIERSAAEIEAAIAASDVGKAREANQKMERETGEHKLLIGQGKVGEGAAALSQAALSHFGGPCAKAMAALGYGPAPPPEPALPMAAEPFVASLHGHLADLDFEAAENELRGAITHAADEMKVFLASQLLALLWTKVILRPAQMQLPSAVHLARCLAVLNAEFIHWPPVRQAAAQILDPLHPLHHLGLHDNVHISFQADFAAAAAEALDSGQSLLFWNPQNLQLTRAGFLQLRDLLDGRQAEMTMVTPVIAAMNDEIGRLAFEAHARHGAEFRRIENRSPVCLMLSSQILAKGKDLEELLAYWPLFEAPGVLALKSYGRRATSHEQD